MGSFFERMEEYRDAIVDKWVEYALNTYPQKSAAFFSKQMDPFLNPIGNILRKELANIFSEILMEQASDRIEEYVDAIVRFRAVQDFSPSDAVKIFWGVKDVVEDVIGVETEEFPEFLEFHRKVDQLCFLAFDVFMKCREKLWELKTKEFHAAMRNILRLYQAKKEEMEVPEEGNNCEI